MNHFLVSMKKQKTKPKKKPSKLSASKNKSRRLAFESEYFTIRSIKKQTTQKGPSIVIVCEPESNISKDGSRTKFEISLNEHNEVVESVQPLSVGDIVSAQIKREQIDFTVVNKVISHFIKVVELVVEGRLALDPVLISADGAEEIFLMLEDYSNPSNSRDSKLDWRKVHVPAIYQNSIKQLTAGTYVSVKCRPINYFNSHTRTNDILWEAFEKVKKCK